MCIKIWDKKVKVCDSFVFLKCIVVVKNKLEKQIICLDVCMYIKSVCLGYFFIYVCRIFYENLIIINKYLFFQFIYFCL